MSHICIVNILTTASECVVLFSSLSRAVSSGYRRAKREQDELPCGDLALETATLWRQPSEAPLWASVDFSGVFVCVHMSDVSCKTIIGLAHRWQERNTFYYSRPKILRLLLLWHSAGLLWPWSDKGERWGSVIYYSLCRHANSWIMEHWPNLRKERTNVYTQSISQTCF